MKHVSAGRTSVSIPFALSRAGLVLTECRYSYTRYSLSDGTSWATDSIPVSGILATIGTPWTLSNAKYTGAVSADGNKFVARFDISDLAFAEGADYVVVSIYDDLDEEIAHMEIELRSYVGNGYSGYLVFNGAIGSVGAVPGVNGTDKNPSSSGVDIISLADSTGIRHVKVFNSFGLNAAGTALQHALFEGMGADAVWQEGSTNASDFSTLKNFKEIDDAASDALNRKYQNSGIENFPLNIQELIMEDCWLNTNVVLNPLNPANAKILNLNTLDKKIVVDGVNNAAMNVFMAGLKGDIDFNNLINALHVVHLHIMGGTITINSTCTAGFITITGWGQLINNTGGTNVFITDFQETPLSVATVTLDNSVANKNILASGIWGALRSGHTISGSFGENVNSNLTKIAGASTVDTVSIGMLFKIMLAYTTGRFKVDLPNEGDITFYEQDNTTVIFVMHVTPEERTRL